MKDIELERERDGGPPGRGERGGVATGWLLPGWLLPSGLNGVHQMEHSNGPTSKDRLS